MRTLSDFTLVAPELFSEQKQGRIILPDNAAVKKCFGRGRIVVAGPGKYSFTGVQLPPPFKVGDRVLYFRDQAIPIMVGGEEMHIIAEPHVIAIFELPDFENTAPVLKMAEA